VQQQIAESCTAHYTCEVTAQTFLNSRGELENATGKDSVDLRPDEYQFVFPRFLVIILPFF
jgi:hypothetical protein